MDVDGMVSHAIAMNPRSFLGKVGQHARAGVHLQKGLRQEQTLRERTPILIQPALCGSMGE